MRRLVITSLCAIALLSSYAAGGGGGGPETKITLPCPGKNVDTKDHPVHKLKQTIQFDFGGKCNFTDFHFVGYEQGNPPHLTRHLPITYPSAAILYDYDGMPLPTNGYEFKYINDGSTLDGNGSGIVKNTTN